MSNNFIDVHTFDGKLKGFFTPSRIYTIDEKKISFSNLITLLTDVNAIYATQTMVYHNMSENNLIYLQIC